MINSPIGKIEIYINGEIYSYNEEELNKSELNFVVDKRYKIVIGKKAYTTDEKLEAILEIKLDIGQKSEDIQREIESGECLASIAFYNKNKKLTLGVEDELPNVKCSYTDNGMRIFVAPEAKIKEVVFGIAWVTIEDEEVQDIYTWFAADPNMFKL